jgi:hypothetical protein
MCCRILLYGIKAPPVAGSVSLLACPPGRSRVLRAAWRPCSRGPARRAVAVASDGYGSRREDSKSRSVCLQLRPRRWARRLSLDAVAGSRPS